MLPHDIVVIGGSAGGIEAMNRLVSASPADLSAAVFVVIHTAPTADSRLPWIFRRKGALPATDDPGGCPRSLGRGAGERPGG